MSGRKLSLTAAFLFGANFMLHLFLFGGVVETPEDIGYLNEAHRIMEQRAAEQHTPDFWED